MARFRSLRNALGNHGLASDCGLAAAAVPATLCLLLAAATPGLFRTACVRPCPLFPDQGNAGGYRGYGGYIGIMEKNMETARCFHWFQTCMPGVPTGSLQYKGPFAVDSMRTPWPRASHDKRAQRKEVEQSCVALEHHLFLFAAPALHHGRPQPQVMVAKGRTTAGSKGPKP